MKRVTVALTLSENTYAGQSDLRKLRMAMVNAGVAKATELNMEIAKIEAKTGHVRSSS